LTAGRSNAPLLAFKAAGPGRVPSLKTDSAALAPGQHARAISPRRAATYPAHRPAPHSWHPLFPAQHQVCARSAMSLHLPCTGVAPHGTEFAPVISSVHRLCFVPVNRVLTPQLSPHSRTPPSPAVGNSTRATNAQRLRPSALPLPPGPSRHPPGTHPGKTPQNIPLPAGAPVRQQPPVLFCRDYPPVAPFRRFCPDLVPDVPGCRLVQLPSC
jgi:hypothetical protein